MRLASSLAGAGIGGGITAGSMLALKLAVPYPKSPDEKAKVFVHNHAAKIAWGAGVIASGVLLATKRKDAALASVIASTAAGLPGIVFELKAASDAKKAAAAAAAAAGAAAPAAGATKGFGIAVAEARGFGAPAVEVFSAAPSSVQLLGTPSQEASAGAQFSPVAFGGGVF